MSHTVDIQQTMPFLAFLAFLEGYRIHPLPIMRVSEKNGLSAHHQELDPRGSQDTTLTSARDPGKSAMKFAVQVFLGQKENWPQNMAELPIYKDIWL